MGSDRRSQYTQMSGILLPHPTYVGMGAAAIESTYSTLTEAGPRPGIAEAQNQTDMVVESGGTQDASKALRLQAIRSGMPGIDAAGFAWRYGTLPDALWRGWDVPTVVTEWENAKVLSGVATASSLASLHAVALADGTILIAHGWVIGGNDVALVMRRDPVTRLWSTIAVKSYGYAFGAGRGPGPALLQLPSGRVLCFYWVQIQLGASAGSVQMDMSYSDDSGTTWTAGATSCLPDPIVYTAAGAAAGNYSVIGRIAVGYSNEQILMFAESLRANTAIGAGNNRDHIRQFASSNLGSSFTVVANTDDIASEVYTGGRPVILVSGGKFVVLWASNSNSGDNGKCVILGSAYDARDAFATINVTGNGCGSRIAAPVSGTQLGPNAELTGCVADDGALWVHCRNDTATFDGFQSRSIDGGLTWDPNLGQSALDASTSEWHMGMVAQIYPRELSACWHDGRVVLAHRSEDGVGAGTYDDGINVSYLGGPSAVTMRSYDGTNRATEQTAWEIVYVPYALPVNVNWTAVGAGTETQNGSALHISTVGNGRSFYRQPLGSIAEGMTVEVDMDQGAAGVSATVKRTFLKVKVGDGAANYDVEIWFGNATLRIVDVNNGSAALAGGDTTVPATVNGIEVRVELTTAIVRWWWRARSTKSDREWIAGPGSTTLVAGGAAASEVRWGHNTSTIESNWRRVVANFDDWTGAQLATAPSNPTGLHPRNFAGQPVYVDLGTTVTAVDGPALHADTWHIDTRYDKERSRVLPWVSPSPRHYWQSTDTTVHRFHLPFSSVLTVPSRGANVLQGVAFIGCNFRTGIIERDAGARVFSAIRTFDAAEGMASMGYIRSGNCLIPDVGTDRPYLFLDEARGWVVDLGGGTLRRVISNTQGHWYSASPGKLAAIYFEGEDGTEPASGTMSMWPSDFVVLWRDNAPNYAGLRAVIDSQAVVAADVGHRIGNLLPGYMLIFGQPPGWGAFAADTEANVELFEAADWTSRHRKRSPARRVVDVPFVDGVDLTQVLAAVPSPDYITSTSTGTPGAVASWVDGPMQLQGLMHLLSGPGVPGVLCPRIPMGPTDSIVLNRRHQLIYGRQTSPIRVEPVMGAHGSTTVVLVPTVTWQELV